MEADLGLRRLGIFITEGSIPDAAVFVVEAVTRRLGVAEGSVVVGPTEPVAFADELGRIDIKGERERAKPGRGQAFELVQNLEIVLIVGERGDRRLGDVGGRDQANRATMNELDYGDHKPPRSPSR